MPALMLTRRLAVAGNSKKEPFSFLFISLCCERRSRKASPFLLYRQYSRPVICGNKISIDCKTDFDKFLTFNAFIFKNIDCSV